MPQLEPDTQESEFVDAFAVSTGRPVRVPRHFLDHPVIGKGFRKTKPKGTPEPETASTQSARTRGAAQTPAVRGEE